MKSAYQICTRKENRQLAEFLAREGQRLLPMLDLITESRAAVDELVDVMGRATLEAILLMSAQEVAGPKHPGKAGRLVRWHGRQAGVVVLSERKVRVQKPRLRRKGPGAGAEAEVPAYEAMQRDERLGRRILEILMEGVSTRSYGRVLPQMAETVGVSKSAVSREFIEASEEALKALAERDFGALDILIVYLDGLIFGGHHVIVAVGVDAQGHKHVLGLVEGASENAAAASLREGLEETFTVNALGLPADLRRCLATTNLVESPQSGVRQRTRRVTRWKDGAMVLRWAATALAQTEKHFRRIIGYKNLWMLKSYLDGEEQVASPRKAG